MNKAAAKVATVGMAAVMAVSFVGCGNAHKSANNTETPKTTTKTTAVKKVAAKKEATKTKKVTEAKKLANKAMMATDYETLINDIMEEKVEVGAHELENFVQNYGDQCSYQTLDAAAENIFASMLKENDNCDFSAPFKDKMEFVEDKCLEDNADLETDVAYNQVVNAINHQVRVMHKNLVKAEKKAEAKKAAAKKAAAKKAAAKKAAKKAAKAQKEAEDQLAKVQKKLEDTENALNKMTEELENKDNTTDEATTQMSKDFTKLMVDIIDEKCEDAATELEAFVTTYGDQISYQSMEAAVEANYTAMLEANDNCDFSAPYELKMEVITGICEDHNANLKTDKGYNNVVNAIMNYLDTLAE